MADRILVGIYRAVGAGVGIAAMEGLATMAGEPIARVPFVTSIVLVMALPEADPSRPRAIVGGHLASALAGWLALSIIGQGEISGAVGVGVATLAMILGRCIHPPAGINALLIPALALPARWIVNPVFIGAVLLAAYAWLWRRGEALLFRRGLNQGGTS